MPKMKTNRAAAKRFKFTGTGKIKVNSAKRRHMLTKKSTKVKRQMRKGGIAPACEEYNIKRLVPYG